MWTWDGAPSAVPEDVEGAARARRKRSGVAGTSIRNDSTPPGPPLVALSRTIASTTIATARPHAQPRQSRCGGQS